MLNDSVSEALETLREYATAEPDLTKVSDLLVELNVILDTLDSRLNPN
jgi:hypothetical protein